MTLFTEWSDVSQTSGAIGRFLAQTRATEENKKTHYWHESTREFINARWSAAETGQLLSVWTSSDVLYASAIGLSVFPNDSNLLSIVQGSAKALSELVKERNSTFAHAKAIKSRAHTIAELISEIGPGGLHDNLRDAMMLLGVPRSIPRLVQIYGPSHSISTASSLRALCAAAKVIPSIRGEVEEAVGLLTEQLRSISHSEVITYLRLKKIGKEHAVDWQAYERELPEAFIAPGYEVPEAGRAWSIATGFAVDMNGVKAWQLYPWKGRKSPDVIATAYVLDSLSASYVFAKDKDKAEAARIADDVITSSCGYLIPQTVSLMCRQPCTPKPGTASGETKECIGAGILDGVTVERITYSDLTRLIYAISNIVDALSDECSDRIADLRTLLCALVTKLMEKLFVDLSRFQRSPYDRITTRILSGAEVEEWPGVDVSFIVPALLASLPVLPQGFLEKYSGRDCRSEYFQTPLGPTHPVFRLLMMELESQILAVSDIEKQKEYLAIRYQSQLPVDANLLDDFVGGMVWGGTDGSDLFAYEDIYIWQTASALLGFSLYAKAIAESQLRGGKDAAAYSGTPSLIPPQIQELSTLRMRVAELELEAQKYNKLGRWLVLSRNLDVAYWLLVLLVAICGMASSRGHGQHQVGVFLFDFGCVSLALGAGLFHWGFLRQVFDSKTQYKKRGEEGSSIATAAVRQYAIPALVAGIPLFILGLAMFVWTFRDELPGMLVRARLAEHGPGIGEEFFLVFLLSALFVSYFPTVMRSDVWQAKSIGEALKSVGRQLIHIRHDIAVLFGMAE